MPSSRRASAWAQRCVVATHLHRSCSALCLWRSPWSAWRRRCTNFERLQRIKHSAGCEQTSLQHILRRFSHSRQWRGAPSLAHHWARSRNVARNRPSTLPHHLQANFMVPRPHRTLPDIQAEAKQARSTVGLVSTTAERTAAAGLLSDTVNTAALTQRLVGFHAKGGASDDEAALDAATSVDEYLEAFTRRAIGQAMQVRAKLGVWLARRHLSRPQRRPACGGTRLPHWPIPITWQRNARQITGAVPRRIVPRAIRPVR